MSPKKWKTIKDRVKDISKEKQLQFVITEVDKLQNESWDVFVKAFKLDYVD